MKSNKSDTMTNRTSANERQSLKNRLESVQEEHLAGMRISTGVAELDEILHGGFIPRRSYLVRGDPGCGKTTLGMHFLCTGAKRQEAALFVSVGESQDQIYADAASIGLDMKGVAFLDLSANSHFFTEMESYDLLDPIGSDEESYGQKIIKQIEMLKPQRVFLDTMTQLRILSPDTFQFRRQVLAFLNFLTEQEATVLFTSESNDVMPDEDLKEISDGIINLISTPSGRKLSISKFRGSGYRAGLHAMRLTERGLEVFPRLNPRTYTRHYEWERMSSGMPELDDLLHGGVSRETITIVTGPTGVGKTTL